MQLPHAPLDPNTSGTHLAIEGSERNMSEFPKLLVSYSATGKLPRFPI
jgi:hypothetical protein